MPKIPALPPMTSPDGADELPIEDVSTSNTKYITLTRLKEWLQSLVGWVTTAMIGNKQVTADKLSLAGASDYQAGSVSTSSGSFVDLSNGPSITLTVGEDGILIVSWQAQCSSGPGTMSFALSGANTLNPDLDRVIYSNNVNQTIGNAVILTGLNPGVTTVTAKYKSDTGTSSFLRRRISAVAI